MLLYCATHKDNLNSIKKLGLGTKPSKICLSKSSTAAYAKYVDNVSEHKHNSEIIILAVYAIRLNKKYFKKNEDVKSETFFTYENVIPSQELYVVTSKNGIVGKLNVLTEIPTYK